MNVALKLFDKLSIEEFTFFEQKGFKKVGLRPWSATWLEWSATWLVFDFKSMTMTWEVDLPKIDPAMLKIMGTVEIDEPKIFMDMEDLKKFMHSYRGEILSGKIGI